MKRYVVISRMTSKGPEYRIYDQANERTLEGGFDTEKWAESICEMMNEKEREKNGDNQRRSKQEIL